MMEPTAIYRFRAAQEELLVERQNLLARLAEIEDFVRGESSAKLAEIEDIVLSKCSAILESFSSVRVECSSLRVRLANINETLGGAAPQEKSMKQKLIELLSAHPKGLTGVQIGEALGPRGRTGVSALKCRGLVLGSISETGYAHYRLAIRPTPVAPMSDDALQQKVVTLLKANKKGLTHSRIQELLGSRGATQACVLRRNGVIETLGGGRGAIYRLTTRPIAEPVPTKPTAAKPTFEPAVLHAPLDVEISENDSNMQKALKLLAKSPDGLTYAQIREALGQPVAVSANEMANRCGSVASEKPINAGHKIYKITDKGLKRIQGLPKVLLQQSRGNGVGAEKALEENQ